MHQDEDETLEDFADLVYVTTTNGYPDAPDDLIEVISVDHFLRGCKNKQAALLANMVQPKTMAKPKRRSRTRSTTSGLFK